MKSIHVFWLVFILNFTFAIVVYNTLPFKSPGEKSGYIISANVLYLIPYGLFTLIPRFQLYRIHKMEAKKPIPKNSSLALMLKFGLYAPPCLAFIGALCMLIFDVPKTIAEENYRYLNGIGMLLGMVLGGLHALHRVRKYYAT